MSRKLRILPSGLKAQAARRTNGAVEALSSAMTTMKAEFEANNYDLAEPLNVKHVQARAGLNAKFLYGKKHKDTTRRAVEKFVAQINDEWERRRGPSREPTSVERARSDAAYWQERHSRLAAHANIWFHRMRQQQRQIRDLQATVRQLQEAGGTVVRLVSERSSS